MIGARRREELDTLRYLHLHVAGHALQNFRDVEEARLAVDRVLDGFRLLRDDFVHHLVDGVGGQEHFHEDVLRLPRPMNAVRSLVGRFGAVLQINEDDVIRRGDGVAAVEAIERCDDDREIR